MNEFYLELSGQVAGWQLLANQEMTGMDLVNVVSRVLHVLGAVILGGGVFFLRSVLVPTGDEQWFKQCRAIWARWVGIATFLLLASGIYNFLVINGSVKEAGEKLEPTYHALFGVKVLLGLAVMFLAAILAGKTNAADKFRQNSARWINIAWYAVLAIIVIAAFLSTMHL